MYCNHNRVVREFYVYLLWKIHWNTKTRKSEEISSVVHMLWTNEFVQECMVIIDDAVLK